MSLKVHPNVKLGKESKTGPFVIIGEPPRGSKPGELRTVIGDGANIRSGTVIYSGTSAGSGLETGHGALIRENCKIGNDVSVGSNAVVERDCTIGNGVRIHSQAFIPEYCNLRDGAWVGPGAVLTNADYPKSIGSKKFLHGPDIHENAKIGANATILPGIVVGKDALVGAGSVVTKDVPPGAVVVGNPAKKIKDVSELCRKSGEKAY
jgi:acetyltransferase-like isoleucine patch superfamily enzyme